MIATNTMDKAMNLNTVRFVERMKGFTRARNVITNETISNISSINLLPKTAVVLELMK